MRFRPLLFPFAINTYHIMKELEAFECTKWKEVPPNSFFYICNENIPYNERKIEEVVQMMNFSLVVAFIIMVVPLLVIMMGIAIWSDVKAKEVELETNED